jgi:hypothetical protein
MPLAPVAAPLAAPVAAPAAGPAPAAPERARFGALLEVWPPLRAAPAPGGLQRPALSALAVVERAQARLDAVLAAARSGRTFSAAELLGLQTEAYRCAQTVDLAAKLVEQGAQSVKQALNTQV